MPRLTLISDESTFKDARSRFDADPGAYRSPVDFCCRCWRHIDTDKLAATFRVDQTFVAEQVAGLAAREGHWDDAHPDYDGCGYTCFQCDCDLTEAADGYEDAQ